jgi:hypothetical protein
MACHHVLLFIPIKNWRAPGRPLSTLAAVFLAFGVAGGASPVLELRDSSPPRVFRRCYRILFCHPASADRLIHTGLPAQESGLRCPCPPGNMPPDVSGGNVGCHNSGKASYCPTMWRPCLLLNVLQCIGQKRTFCPQMFLVLRLGSPGVTASCAASWALLLLLDGVSLLILMIKRPLDASSVRSAVVYDPLGTP